MDLMDMLKSADSFNRARKPAPLQRVGDVGFERKWQTAAIEREGHHIVYATNTKMNETVLVYRMYFGDGIDDETIPLRARVFSELGVKINDPNMYLIHDPDDAHLTIADLQVDKSDSGRGYGSALMSGMFEVIQRFENPVKYISGWISSVDWNHVDRSVHFYNKHGFECELNHEIQSGSILWINPDADGSLEEYKASVANGDGIS